MRQTGAGRFVEPGGHEALDGAIINRRTVRRQIRSLGHDVEASEERDAVIRNEVHDMVFAFLADELERQECAHGLLGGNHRGAGQLGLTSDFRQAQLAHQRHEDEQSAKPGAESAWREIEHADIGNRGGFRTNGVRTVFVASARQAGEAFLMQQDRQRVDADRMPLGCELTLNVVDRQILFSQGDGAFADEIANGSMSGAGAWLGEERLAFAASWRN